MVAGFVRGGKNGPKKIFGKTNIEYVGAEPAQRVENAQSATTRGIMSELHGSPTPSAVKTTTKKTYAQTEEHIASLFQQGETINYYGETYTVSTSGKPYVAKGGGEGKTDVYISMTNSEGEEEEFKISIKQKNADFLENKVSGARMQQICGEGWEKRYQGEFEKLCRIVEDNSIESHNEDRITMGYRIDFLNKRTRKLSSDIELTPEEKKEIFAGDKLPPQKRDSLVNGEMIKDSGVANYMLMGDIEDYDSPQKVLDSLVSIDDYVRSDECKVYMGASAVNYRRGGKIDGNRPLALYYDHTMNEDGRISSVLKADDPFKLGSKDRAMLLSDDIKNKYA